MRERRNLGFVDVPRTRYAVASGGVRIAYQVVGDGPVDLVCVPSAVSHLEVFWEEPSVARYLRRLASFSRLILFDKRGVGMSDRIQGVPTLDERIDDMRAVMDAVESSPAALFGMSEGGAIAALFATTYPERVGSLVMLGSAIRCYVPPGVDYDDPAVLVSLDEQHGDGRRIDKGAPSVAHDERVRAWLGRVERLGTTPTSLLALLRMNASFDTRSVLPAVSAPTLVIHRSGDLVVAVDQGREAAQLIPGARYVELPGADHVPYFDDPETTLALIEEFVTGRPPASRAMPARADECRLTDRELDVLGLIADGRTNRQVAGELCISPETVSHHLRHIFAKTGSSNRTEASAYAHRHGLVRQA